MVEAAQDFNLFSKVIELRSGTFDHFDGEWLPI
jgi:hypothetical protein